MDRKSDERMPGERIAKVIARAGLCSRREAEEWIAAGRVTVNNGTIRSPALNVTPADRIGVDGKPLPGRERTRLFLHHKPAGLITANNDPQGRPTIFDRLPAHLPRLVSVGRLDINTEGLILLTNDGGLARVLELPETGWLRRYRVRAHGTVTQAQLDALCDGVTVDGIQYGPIEATLDRDLGSNVWLTFAIREGKNREVRNVLGHLGLQVARLIRVSFGPFQLGELAEGAVEEVPTRILRDQLGERVTRAAGADFEAPLTERKTTPAPAKREERKPQREDRERAPRHGQEERNFRPRDRKDDRSTEHPARERPKAHRSGDAWREHDAPGKRRFHGARSGEARPPHDPERPKRAGLLKDRKGRRVLVERIRAAEPAPPPERPKPRKHRRRDRSSGPRPSRPKS
jgi:23S rRNA pseudouridine2605 synthase